MKITIRKDDTLTNMPTKWIFEGKRCMGAEILHQLGVPDEVLETGPAGHSSLAVIRDSLPEKWRSVIFTVSNYTAMTRIRSEFEAAIMQNDRGEFEEAVKTFTNAFKVNSPPEEVEIELV